MESINVSRRSLLQAVAALVATSATSIGWTEVVQALDDADAHAQAHADSQAAGDAKISFFSAAEAADVEAVAAQIVPTDDSPGAREAGVVYFIDRALATFYSQLAVDYRAQLASFQSAFRAEHPNVASFAALASEQQIEYLERVDQTPFFNTTRLLTLLGLFSLPAYGGNRGGVGWKLIGFEDRHVFQAPFGYYDRDYPGFALEAERSK